METWTVIADETNASLLVQSNYGPFYEIESWKGHGNHPKEEFTRQIAARLHDLEGNFDRLIVAAPAAVLDRFRHAFPPALSRKVAAHPRHLTHLSRRELRQELHQLMPRASAF